SSFLIIPHTPTPTLFPYTTLFRSTNHTLPTNGWVRSYGGVATDSFTKQVTFQSLTKAGLTALSPTIVNMAKAEGLEAHAKAVSRSEEHTSELQSPCNLVCRLLLEK